MGFITESVRRLLHQSGAAKPRDVITHGEGDSTDLSSGEETEPATSTVAGYCSATCSPRVYSSDHQSAAWPVGDRSFRSEIRGSVETDFETSDAIVLVGSDLCVSHPEMWNHVTRNRRFPEIVVVDPVLTETAMNASQYLPLAPKSDESLFCGVARILIERGWIDSSLSRSSTQNFDEFAGVVDSFTDVRVVRDTGLSIDRIHRLAQTIHNSERIVFWWSMVASSTETARGTQALINLALLTGKIGQPPTRFGGGRLLGQEIRWRPERATVDYPFTLVTGRVCTSRRNVPDESDASPKPPPDDVFVEINPCDAMDLGIEPNQQIHIQSQRGQVRARAFLTRAVQPSQVFMPMQSDAVDQLTFSTFDPDSNRQRYQVCAVRLLLDDNRVGPPSNGPDRIPANLVIVGGDQPKGDAEGHDDA